MQPAWSSKQGARGGFWLMLYIALIASIGMHALARLAKTPRDEAWRPAVYQYRADTVPDCEQLTGRAALSLSAREEIDWVWLHGLALPAATDGRCRSAERMVL